MLRGYRSIFIALAGLALSAAQQSSNTSVDQGGAELSRNDTNNSPNAVVAIDRLTDEVAKQRDPYGKQREQREQRDIIAQEGMAYWTGPMFWVVIAQTVLAFGALIALIIDLRQNRKSSERQLRAYIIVEPGGVQEGRDGNYVLPVSIKNVGQTPAYALEHFGNIIVFTDGHPRDFYAKPEEIWVQFSPETDMVFGQGQNECVHVFQEMSEVRPFLERIRNRSAAIVHYGYVSYRDVFKRPQRTYYGFFHWGEDWSAENTLRCSFGNHAT